MGMSPVRERPLVLIAARDAELRALLGRLFREADYEAALVSDGVEVLAAVPRLRPDALVLDADLGRLDGLTALELLGAGDHAAPAVLLAPVCGLDVLAAAARLGARA